MIFRAFLKIIVIRGNVEIFGSWIFLNYNYN